MFSVGETLQRARLEQELAVATVAARTRINAKYLEAIEAGDRSRLPSSFFYKSFVHQYARTLLLDTKEIDAEIDRVLSADAPPLLPGQYNLTWKVPPPVLSFGFRKSKIYALLAGLILMLAACSSIYGWWYRGHSGEIVTTEISAPVLHPAIPTLPAIPVALASEAEASPQSPVVQGASLLTPASKVLLDLTAREDTWVSISSDGQPVFSGILAANQSKTVAGKEYSKLRVGNAAGLEVRLNGKLLAPLGHRGQVLVVVFTGDNIQIMPPVKESD